jgi:hypothetical protein
MSNYGLDVLAAAKKRERESHRSQTTTSTTSSSKGKVKPERRSLSPSSREREYKKPKPSHSSSSQSDVVKTEKSSSGVSRTASTPHERRGLTAGREKPIGTPASSGFVPPSPSPSTYYGRHGGGSTDKPRPAATPQVSGRSNNSEPEATPRARQQRPPGKISRKYTEWEDENDANAWYDMDEGGTIGLVNLNKDNVDESENAGKFIGSSEFF